MCMSDKLIEGVRDLMIPYREGGTLYTGQSLRALLKTQPSGLQTLMPTFPLKAPNF